MHATRLASACVAPVPSRTRAHAGCNSHRAAECHCGAPATVRLKRSGDGLPFYCVMGRSGVTTRRTCGPPWSSDFGSASRSSDLEFKCKFVDRMGRQGATVQEISSGAIASTHHAAVVAAAAVAAASTAAASASTVAAEYCVSQSSPKRQRRSEPQAEPVVVDLCDGDDDDSSPSGERRTSEAGMNGNEDDDVIASLGSSQPPDTPPVAQPKPSTPLPSRALLLSRHLPQPGFNLGANLGANLSTDY